MSQQSGYPIFRTEDQEIFLAPSADKQTYSYDTQCSNKPPSLTITTQIRGIVVCICICIYIYMYMHIYT